MRLLLFLFFALIVAPIHAFEAPVNAPGPEYGPYIVVDGKIYVEYWGGMHVWGFQCETLEDAERIVSLWPEWCADYEAHFGHSPTEAGGLLVPPVYNEPLVVEQSNGKFSVFFLFTEEYTEQGSGGTFWNSPLNLVQWFDQKGVSYLLAYADGYASDDYYFGYYADAEYPEDPEPEPQEPTPPEGLADGCITYYQGAWRYTSEREGPTADVIFRGPSLYADTEEDAERCAAAFADFLASYEWPWYGRPAVLPWSEPKVYKCHVIRGGAVSFVFWRVFFQDYTGDKIETIGQYDSAYMQCLNDYGLQGAGTGGYNVIEIYGPSATASASNTGSVQLNGNQLASGESGTSTVKLTSGSKDVAVTQYTVQKVDAESDTVGMSEVTSEASVSEGSDGSINVTNNTTINTTLELGDAPAADSFTTEERQVSSSSDLLTETEPEYSYIVKGGSEDYSLDWEKFWSDVEDRLNEIFHFEDIKIFFETGVSSSDMITDWTITVFGYSFVVPWSQVAQLEVVQFARTAMSYLCILGTCLASFKLMV